MVHKAYKIKAAIAEAYRIEKSDGMLQLGYEVEVHSFKDKGTDEQTQEASEEKTEEPGEPKE